MALLPLPVSASGLNAQRSYHGCRQAVDFLRPKPDNHAEKAHTPVHTQIRQVFSFSTCEIAGNPLFRVVAFTREWPFCRPSCRMADAVICAKKGAENP
jgi:hypothetical protein